MHGTLRLQQAQIALALAEVDPATLSKDEIRFSRVKVEWDGSRGGHSQVVDQVCTPSK